MQVKKEDAIFIDPQRWVALKFGGTSVASAEGWATIAAACRAEVDSGDRALLVCSAVSGVSDTLEQAIVDAANGVDTTATVLALRRRRERLSEALGVALPAGVLTCLEEVETSLQGIALLREAPARVQARIMVQGERMSTQVGAQWLAR